MLVLAPTIMSGILQGIQSAACSISALSSKVGLLASCLWICSRLLTGEFTALPLALVLSVPLVRLLSVPLVS